MRLRERSLQLMSSHDASAALDVFEDAEEIRKNEGDKEEQEIV